MPELLTPTAPADAPEGPLAALWSWCLPAVEAAMAACGARPERTVVWLPYAQAMAEARRAWAQRHPVGFAPRFESSRNWAAGLAPFEPAPTDLSHDTARDSLLAAAMVERLGVAGDPALRGLLATRLLEAARQLAPLAAAVAPEDRATWAQAMTERLAGWSSNHDFLRWEQALAQLALAWVGHGGFATDVLWGPLAAPGEAADCLVLLTGAQPDPLAQALCRRWGERAVWLDLPEPAGPPAAGLVGGSVVEPQAGLRLHACLDSEDEAQRAAACVLVHLNQGRQPVALVATDRLLTRRVSAWLLASGVRLRDETGWKLSTTHSAAQLMAWLRAARAQAPMDDVLDALKQLPPAAPLLARSGLDALEQRVRRLGPARWRDAVQHPGLQPFLPATLAPLLQSLQPARPLLQWLEDWRTALQAVGLWGALNGDAAGRQVLSALRLEPDAAEALAPVAAAATAATGAGVPSPAGGRPLGLAAFTAWVREVLEGATFVAAQVAAPQVVVLPLGQLLGRGFAATVAPGCDEQHLSPHPEPPGDWTEAQREGLGLATRGQLARAAQHLWQALLAQPQLDVLWRTQTGGELCLPSPWVQALLGGGADLAPDPRAQQALMARPVGPPQARAPGLLPERLSASAYQRLRDCPYRFFALSMLGLSEAPELDVPPSQREFGTWLHEVLRRFHEARHSAAGAWAASAPEPTQAQTEAWDRAQLQALAEQVALAQGLAVDPERAGFLPFWSLWPALRDGYLAWLWAFEAQPNAPRFESAELALRQPMGDCTLVGTLDRVDAQHSPSGPVRLVLDYKTESRATTKARVQDPLEDTQLAFYAALIGGENLRAAYLSISDKRDEREGATALFEQTDIELALNALLRGMQADWRRLANGHPMAALGEGRVCNHCEARGLCRKDHWQPA